jgi:RimJ/RimL family protein N-acetyltransferase
MSQLSQLPTLLTHRLILRPAARTDLEYLYSLWSTPQIRKYLFDDAEVELALAQSVLEDCLARVEQGCGLWLLITRTSAVCLGCVGLNPTTVVAEY